MDNMDIWDGYGWFQTKKMTLGETSSMTLSHHLPQPLGLGASKKAGLRGTWRVSST